jgi:hypothetical protein
VIHALHVRMRFVCIAALVKVSYDILIELVKKKCVYLVLLDLSAMFDTMALTTRYF